MLLVHGFPGLWYSWREQLTALAEAGFLAVALDTRGYGGSSRPLEVEAYDTHAQVADLVAVLDAVGADEAVLVGHDFGAKTCWSAATHELSRDRVKAVVSVAVPYGVGFAKSGDGASGADGAARQPRLPSETYAKVAERHFFHMHYFQAPGVADRELGDNARTFLKRIHWALSGEGSLLDWTRFPSEGTGYLDVLAEPGRPLPWGWFDEDDLDTFVREYTRDPERAFLGGLSAYRVADHNAVVDPDYGRTPVTQPSLFICGESDPVLKIVTPKSLETMKERVPNLRGTHLVAGAGHFVQQEKSAEFNALLLSFLGEV